MRRPQDHLRVKVGDKVYLSSCDTSASVVWGDDGEIILDKDGDLCVKTTYREDKIKNIDGCYTFLEIKNGNN